MSRLDDTAIDRTGMDGPPDEDRGGQPATDVADSDAPDPAPLGSAADNEAPDAGSDAAPLGSAADDEAPDAGSDAAPFGSAADDEAPDAGSTVESPAPGDGDEPAVAEAGSASDATAGTDRAATGTEATARGEVPSAEAPGDRETAASEEPVAPAERLTEDDRELAGPVDAASEPEEAASTTSPGPRTVAGLVAATLRAAGVRVAFTVPGESFLPLLDALADAGIRVVATRHEGAAAFAAEAHGQLTGRPAVCLGTRAVGAANLAIGMHTAFADSTPMFVVVGDVRRDQAGREAFQEIDLVATLGGLATWAGRLDDPGQVVEQLTEAVAAALGGRPGPALLAVPEDVLSAEVPDDIVIPAVRTHPEQPDSSDVQAILHFLAGAERPVILAGAGVLRARCSNDLVRLAELLHVPIIASWRRGDVIPNEHPLYLGMAGFGSPATVRDRLEAADALVVLGSRLGEVTSFGYAIPAPAQRWVHVDAEPRTGPVGDAPAPERAVQADARAFVRAALARLRNAVLLAGPVSSRVAHNADDREAWEAASEVDGAPWSGPGVHPGRVIATLRRILPDDAIITTDAGNFAGWAARGFRFRRPGTFLGPTSGAMGYGVPAALAAALVHRERRVVALVGDGGLGMTIGELETAVREDAHLVAIVFDNQQYGMIRMYQELASSAGHPATDLGPVDFAAMARACGARGVRVDADAAFEPALRTALAASGPSVIQLAVDRRWISVDRRPVVDAEGRPFD